MSLHKFADMVAKQGRGDDSLLIHMTPDEVRNLQKFAEANGKTLTINPTTGLPEAGMLSDLFKTIAPIALGAFLGPAGVALGGPGLTAGMAGLATGGITALATGSLSRGLMAGLGAYGGAGIGESLMNAGTGALSQSVGAGLSEEAAQQAVASKLASATPMETLTAGFNSATASPAAMGTFAKNNLTNIGMAAAPIMAGAMVPTTTKMPENTNPAYIRQKLYDPYTQTYKSLAPVKASEFGSRNFSDAYTNPQTGQMDTLQPRAPSGFAGGGIVALARGGVPGYAGGMLVGDQDVFNYFKGLDQAKLKSGALDAQIAEDMQKYNVGAADIGRITGTQANQGNFEQRFVQAINPATLNSTDFLAKTADVGLTDQALANAMKNAGMSQAAQYAATHQLNDAAGIVGAPTSAQNLYNAIGYKAGDLKGDTGGIAGMYANISGVAGSLQDKINSGALTVAQAQNLSLAEMDRLGINQADIKGATGKDFGNLFTAKKPDPIVCGPGMELNAAGTACVPIKKIDDKKTVDKTCGTGYTWSEATQSCVKDIIEWKACETGYHWDKTAQACVKNTSAVDTTTTTVNTPTSLTTVPATALPVGVGGTTGPSIFGGGATVNPNGTITTSPVIPGIPVGGFTGMESLRNAYTTGGGSLGYIPKAPKTMAEFEQLYNKQTGDSLAAYDYLMGKGGGKYHVQSKAASTAEGIMRPYFSAGVKYKPRFLSAGKDGTVTESSTNPNAPKAGGAKAAELTKAKTIDIVDSSGYNTETYTAVLQEDGTYLAGNGKRYDVNGKQIAAGGGMMGYAMGGGLGSLGSYSDGGRLLKGPGDGVSDSIPATIGRKQQPARLADGEFVIPARIVSELGNGSTDAGAKKLYAMMDRVQRARGKTTGKNKVAANTRSEKYLPA
jgi:hypothetical protein